MSRRVAAPLPWLAGLLAIYLVAPLLAGIREVGYADWHSVDAAALARACAVSFGSASVATLLIALGGIPLGYLLARLPGRTMAALGFVIQLPLALPPLTSGILLLFLVGYGGPLGRLTGGLLTDSFAGIVLAEVFVAAPFLIIAARSAFAEMGTVLEGVAATLGRRPLDVFFRVSLPIAWPAIISGMLLAWLRAFGEFGATVMVAYHPYSLPVYTYVAFGAQGLPAMLPILLPTLVIAVAVLTASGVLTGPRQATRRTRRAAAMPARARGTPPGALADPPQLTLRLDKRLGEFHLDLAWSPQSRRLALLGPSGSGKSLTLRLIAGIEPADRAVITLGGEDLSRLPPPRRGIAYVPQSYGLFPHLTVVQQLRFPVGADPAAARYWIERLSLAGLEDRTPQALSLGQQQRTALARALVRPAGLILLDEPFSALDAPLRARLRAELLALQGEFGATTILVTHDPEEAALLADELLVIEGGRPLQSGATAALFARPAGEAVARLLGAGSVGEGVAVEDGRIAIGRGVVLKAAGPALPPGTPVGWSIRRGGIRLDPAGPYPGCIERVVPAGLGSHVMIGLGDAHIEFLESRPGCAAGRSCRLEIDPYAVQVWPR